MPKAAINGIEMYYESHGEGPAIVFAHGRGGNHLSWWQQVARFSGEYRCITFDHRGWGHSIAEHGSPLKDNFVDDLTALLDHLGIDETFLVAQSMGGFCCLGFALAHPDRALGVVLGDTTGGVVGPEILAALGRATPLPDSAGPARVLAGGFMKEQPGLTFLFQQISGLNPPRGEDGVVAGFRREDSTNAADLAGWNTPTLLIVGDEDAIFPPEVIKDVHKVIPGSRMEIVRGAAHSTHYEKADIFNRMLADFCAQTLAGKVTGAAAD